MQQPRFSEDTLASRGNLRVILVQSEQSSVAIEVHEVLLSDAVRRACQEFIDITKNMPSRWVLL